MSMTLYEYRVQLGWSRRKLASEAKLATNAVNNAEKGNVIAPETAKALADCLSKAYGREINVLDIKGLNIR